MRKKLTKLLNILLVTLLIIGTVLPAEAEAAKKSRKRRTGITSIFSYRKPTPKKRITVNRSTYKPVKRWYSPPKPKYKARITYKKPAAKRKPVYRPIYKKPVAKKKATYRPVYKKKAVKKKKATYRPVYKKKTSVKKRSASSRKSNKTPPKKPSKKVTSKKQTKKSTKKKSSKKNTSKKSSSKKKTTKKKTTSKKSAKKKAKKKKSSFKSKVKKVGMFGLDLIGATDAYSLVTGKDMASGKKASRGNAAFFLVMTVVPGGKIGKYVGKGAKAVLKGSKVASKIKKASKASKVLSKGAKAAKKVSSKVIKAGKSLGKKAKKVTKKVAKTSKKTILSVTKKSKKVAIKLKKTSTKAVKRVATRTKKVLKKPFSKVKKVAKKQKKVISRAKSKKYTPVKKGKASSNQLKMNLQFFSKKIPISKGKLSHIQKHNIQSLKNQAKYLSDVELKGKLSGTFFSPKWSADKINKNAETAYNALLKNGKKGDTFKYKIDGETISVHINSEGGFSTAYGSYEYTVKQFRKLFK